MPALATRMSSLPPSAATLAAIAFATWPASDTSTACVWRWCRNRIVDVGWSPGALSGDTPRHRHAEPGHAVQRRAADPGLGLLSGQRPGAKATADEGLVPGHGRFAQRPPAVTGRYLPSHAPLVPDQLTWRSRWLGAVPASTLGAAVERGGMTTSTGGSG